MKAISLFSGMGGDSLGMKNAGVKVIAFSENVKYIRDTHLANFNDCEKCNASFPGKYIPINLEKNDPKSIP